MSNDTVTLVTQEDTVLGSMDKMEAHRGEGKLHRAISVFLFRKNTHGKTELLIQQRSATKIVGAGLWANTVCGNVRYGESYTGCAVRRLKEELGINFESQNLVEAHIFTYQVKCNAEFSEHEIDHVFYGNGSAVVPDLNPEEVSQTRWIEWDYLIEKWEKFQGEHSPLGRLEDMTLAPWFVIMLEDSDLLLKLSEKLAQI